MSEAKFRALNLLGIFLFITLDYFSLLREQPFFYLTWINLTFTMDARRYYIFEVKTFASTGIESATFQPSCSTF